MKKIILSLTLVMGLLPAGYSQLSLNEIYSEPNCGVMGTTASDWFELYNGTANNINLNCYRFVAVYQTPNNQGSETFAYVFDLPAQVIPAGSFFVFSGLNTFCYQGAGGTPATYTLGSNGYNWNLMTAATTDASLKRYKLNVATNPDTWDLDQTYINATDVFQLLQISANTDAKYNFFLFNANTTPAGLNDKIENSLLLGYNQTTPPVDITILPNLTQPTLTAGACNSNGSMSFASITSNEQVTSASGSDNGYSREFNGICGTWVKGGPSSRYTPGATNNTNPPPAGSGLFSLTLSQPSCAGNSGTYSAPVNVVFTSSSPYTLTYLVRLDNSPLGSPGNPVPGAEDPQVTQSVYAGSAANQFTVTGLVSERSYFVTAINAAGCYSATIYLPGIGCIVLPVTFKSFTATRGNSNVIVKWETASEQNNTGFAIERNTNGTWQQVAFVPTQAVNGNSDTKLNYSYTDLNNTKGISQYRIKQVDINASSKYTEIRSVRGDGQPGKTIIYPNPSTNGKINIVFEEAAGTRNISVMDLSGRIVKQITGVTNNNVQIDKLMPGMYSLRIIVVETGVQSVEKIIINK
jgi:hypothetical protein